LLYDFVARHRYQVFGKYETCMLPDPRNKHKFVEV
jgi:predicted DCC family thiol-disulfide oxidoreductase YuxK